MVIVRALLLVVVLCLARTAAAAAHDEPRLAEGVRLEVVATQFDIGWNSSYTFLRIYEDARAECEISEGDRWTKIHVSGASGTAGRATIDKLARILEARDFPPAPRAQLGGVVDAGTVWSLAWRKPGGEVLRIEILAEMALSVGPIGAHAKSIEELMCVLEEARSEITRVRPNRGHCGTAVAPSGR